ncbi:MAG TPA: CPBP family intramembrane glutamic endopeptidase [Mycobacterium sp.]|nr:CPBP family intramembrane glutamic endopeptidase [Mycobacterium sp.]
MTRTKSARPGLLREFTAIITNVAAPYHEPKTVVLRRRIVVAVVLVAGAALLGLMHSRQAGDPVYYWLALTLAAVWGAGALLSGPLHLGMVRFRGRNERPVFTGSGVGLLLGGVFLVGGLVVREIAPLAHQVTDVLAFATQASWRVVVLVALLNAITEEMFFRAALFTSFGRRYPVVGSTVLYVAAMMATGNLMLGFAALVLGTVCAVERRATGGVLASVLTHLVWGLIMVLALPPLFGM